MKTCLFLLVLAVVVLDQIPRASARVFVLPHVLESSGKINPVQYTFDTTIFANYVGAAGGGGGGGATVDFYLFDSATNAPMEVNGKSVCDPCSLNVSAADPRVSLLVDDCIVSAGGYSSADAIKLGFGILVVPGSDPDNVSVQGQVVNSHGPGLDLSVFGFDPVPISVDGAARSFVLPHVLESSGKTRLAGGPSDVGGMMDTLLFPTYVGGLVLEPGSLSIPASSSTATLRLTLYNNDRTRMFPSGQAFDDEILLTATNRSPLISLEDIILDRGGFGSETFEGYVDVNITGDAGNVAVQGFIVNSHTNAFDLRLSPVPEPSTALLFSIAAVGLAGWEWRRRRIAA